MDNSSPTIFTNPSSGVRNKCAFNGCRNTKAKFPALHFFKFPVSRKFLCDTWITNCANDAIVSLPKETLRYKVVCENHFTKECFTSDKKNRINAFAVPRSESQIREFYKGQAALTKKKATSKQKGGISDCRPISSGNSAQVKKHLGLVSPSPSTVDNSSLTVCKNPSSGVRNKCSFNGCLNTKAKFPSLHFFKFPVARKCLCDTWILNCANDKLVSLPSETLRCRVVCEKHFTRDCFTSAKKNRINAFAAPGSQS